MKGESMIRVRLHFKDKFLKEFRALNREITIGRELDNTIRIDNPAVSKHHARIIKDRDHYVIEDLESTNGTFIKNKPIRRLALRDDDEIIIGKHTLRISLEETNGWRPCWNFNNMSGDKTMVLETKAHQEIINKKKM